MKNKISFSAIRLVACDFDGVMTDNTVIVDENGIESVICNRSDGLGAEILKKNGIDVIVISKERNKVVKARCDKLKIPCIRGSDDKLSILKAEMKKRNLASGQTCFVGNDINDLECMRHVVGIAVNDAHPEVKKAAKLTTKCSGGHGVVREVADMIMGI
jgi:YrbI family 3-deoxy-D-manno-octulosonate 8-phosphate phosphatase